MEIDPKYSDCIVRRCQAYTGKQVVLEVDGRSFNDVAPRRCEGAGAISVRRIRNGTTLASTKLHRLRKGRQPRSRNRRQ